jgi:DNA-binding MarR family transcriptional regulator
MIGQDDSAASGPHPLVAGRLGYLLKHTQLRFAELTSTALAPYGIDGREFAVLLSLEAEAPLSQREAARRLRIDRTTMVALLDGLEAKGVVERSTNEQDRRKNVVTLSPKGRDIRRRATRTVDALERRFLSPLSDDDVNRFRKALRRLALPNEKE